MNALFAPLALIALTACTSGSDTNESTTGDDTSSDSVTDVYGEETTGVTDLEGWGDEVTTLNANATISGDLSDGEIIDLSFASSSQIACWPTTEDMNFSGNHVFYATYLPEHSKIVATVTPEPGVDVSLYMYSIATTSHYLPEELPSASCEAAYDQINDSNPGESESTDIVAINNPYNVVIGVAGAEGYTSGGYTLRLRLEDY